MVNKYGCICALFVYVVLASSHSLGQDRKDEYARFLGEWRMVSGNNGGRDATAEQVADTTFIFKPNKMLLRSAKGEELEAEMTLDASKSPAWITTKAKDEFGDEMEGIYKFDGDTLTICLGLPGKRPTRFEVNHREERIVVLKRKAK